VSTLLVLVVDEPQDLGTNVCDVQYFNAKITLQFKLLKLADMMETVSRLHQQYVIAGNFMVLLQEYTILRVTVR
jgi:hypothetical protein